MFTFSIQGYAICYLLFFSFVVAINSRVFLKVWAHMWMVGARGEAGKLCFCSLHLCMQTFVSAVCMFTCLSADICHHCICHSMWLRFQKFPPHSLLFQITTAHSKRATGWQGKTETKKQRQHPIFLQIICEC